MSESDLLAVQAEPVPRSEATCRLVAGHAESAWRLIASAVLWIVVAWVAASVPIFVALPIVPAPWTPTEVMVILGFGGAAFVLAWVAFVVIVRRRRRARRELVRDGELVRGSVVESTPGRRATVQFGVGGVERRVAVRLAPGRGGTVPMLAVPGATHALAFAGAHDGRATVAAVRRDVVVDRTTHEATVVFTRGLTESFFAIVFAIVAAELPLIFLVAAKLPPTRLTCERSRDTCAVQSFGIFGTGGTYEFHLSEIARSRVRDRGGEREWVAERRGGHAIDLTGETSDAGQAKEFEAHAQALAAFLANPSAPRLSIEYRGTGRPALPVLVVLSAGSLVLVLRWAHGRRAAVTIDSRARTLTIRRRPALIPPATRTLPLESISYADVKSGRLFVLFAALPTLRLWVRDRNGRVVFARWQLTSRAAHGEVTAFASLLSQRDRL